MAASLLAEQPHWGAELGLHGQHPLHLLRSGIGRQAEPVSAGSGGLHGQQARRANGQEARGMRARAPSLHKEVGSRCPLTHPVVRAQAHEVPPPLGRVADEEQGAVRPPLRQRRRLARPAGHLHSIRGREQRPG